MSHSGKPDSELGLDTLRDRLAESLSCEANKPDFRELDLGSPCSPLRTRQTATATMTTTTTTTTTTSSSSSSSGSVSGRNGPGPGHPSAARRSDSGPSNGYSGELSGSSESSPTAAESLRSGAAAARCNLKLGHARSDSGSSSPAPNLLPTGNICPSGKILKTGMAMAAASGGRAHRSDVLGSGTGNYGHGSIMRGSAAAKCDAAVANQRGNIGIGGCGGGGGRRGMGGVDPEELKRAGNEQFNRRNFADALGLYDQAIALSPGNAAYRSNRAAALTGLGRLWEAVKECEEAVRLDPNYGRAHQRLASLFLRLGQVENARRHISFPGLLQDPAELKKLQIVEKHLNKCTDARRIGDWKSVLREGDAAIAAGADHCPQLSMCRAEAFLKLHQIDDAESSLSSVPKGEPSTNSGSQMKFFGMLSEAYPHFVRAQYEMALGRFENAVTAAEKAGQIDARNVEIAVLRNNVRLVARARSRGNDLFKSERFTEACSAYGEGLRLDPSNPVLYCNRAACWFKLGMWERSIEDCNQALSIQPSYTKAILRRAASNSKLERWEDAVRDYEVLRKELPFNNEVAESLFHAQVALKKSRGEEVYNLKFGGEVEEVSSLDHFRAAVSLLGVSVVHFKANTNTQCKQMSPFIDALCGRYPSINFLKVDIEESPEIANMENVRIVPTFKIYKNGNRVKEIVCPSREILEHSVRHYSF